MKLLQTYRQINVIFFISFCMLDNNLTLYTVLRVHLINVIRTVGGKFILLIIKSQVILYPNTINSVKSCYVLLLA